MNILKENIQQYIPLKQAHRVSKFIYTYDRIKLIHDVISANTYKRVSSKDNSLFALRNELNREKVIRPGIVQKIFEVAMTDKPYEFKELVCISLNWLRLWDIFPNASLGCYLRQRWDQHVFDYPWNI